MKAIVAGSILALCLSLSSGDGVRAQAQAPAPVQTQPPQAGATVDVIRQRGTLRCGVQVNVQQQAGADP